ncbi:hypothetical protein Tsubulata_031440 [Turnera subulata]|uniref:Uncharacterized protein n=1 Tax=Turnera subulata TaxID=218843 RepID=A0A9Q0G6Y0_9ROSI|nr:hypothetical protein Tsubulata_031440 [Turnera subulata]
MKSKRADIHRHRFILTSIFFILFLCALASINEIRFDSFLKFGKCAIANIPFHESSSNSSSTTTNLLPTNSSSNEDDIRILIGILTLPDQYHRRHFLRMIYGTQSPLGAQIDVKFVFCNLTKEDQKVLVALEIMRYDDIIIMNCKENMNKGKTYTYFSSLPEMFNDTDRPYPPYHYVFKADDDTYFRLDNLVESLRPLPREDLYYGYVIPCRSMDPFVHYMSGMGYMISWDIVEWIRDSEIPKNHMEGPEDKIFGEWMREGHRARNRFNAKWSMYNHPEPPTTCTHELWPNTTAVHLLKNQEKWIQTLNYFNVTRHILTWLSPNLLSQSNQSPPLKTVPPIVIHDTPHQFVTLIPSYLALPLSFPFHNHTTTLPRPKKPQNITHTHSPSPVSAGAAATRARRRSLAFLLLLPHFARLSSPLLVVFGAMASSSPAPFSDIGKRAKDLLFKDYNFDHKYTLSVLSPTGMALTATGVNKDQVFVGDINTVYKSGRTTVDVKVDTYSNVSTKVTINDIISSTKTTFSFNIPDHKSGKMDVQYLHHHAAFNSSIGLNPTPVLELAAAVGSKDLSLGGEIGFDTASASFTKYNAGIGLNTPDFSAALILMDKGKTLKASYIHSVDPFKSVAAEMTHRFSTYENSFSIGSSHLVDPITTVKTRFSDNGRIAMLCQREWRPKSLITFSTEYDLKARNAAAPKFGLALALKP